MFINYNNFLVASLGFFFYIILYHFQRAIVLPLPFLFVCLSFIFSCWIALARSSNTMLKRSGNSGCLYLVPHLRGKTFKLHCREASFTSEDIGCSPWTLLFHWRSHGLRGCLGEGWYSLTVTAPITILLHCFLCVYGPRWTL